MKDTIHERLILLATAQECMANVSDKMKHWDDSQLIMEKSSFEMMNVSDDILKLTREGSSLAGKLLECCHRMKVNEETYKQNVAGDLEALYQVFCKISDASSSVSELAHKLECEADIQKGMEETIKNCLGYVGECIASVLADEEMVIADNGEGFDCE